MNEIKWSGFVYLLIIAVHVNCKDAGAILLTSNKLEYTLFPFPLNTTVVKFKVRAPHNAHVLLSSGPNDEYSTAYEIFIGGWRNARSALRFNNTRPDRAIAETIGILNAGELRGFWVNCSQGFVGIGREGELIPFLKWTNLRPFKVQYFGVRTAWGATGEWIIDDSSVSYARVDLFGFHIGLPGIVSVDVLSKTQPFLVWKVHNKTFSEGGLDPTGQYHATKALLTKDGVWQAKLIISTVRIEDTQEEILLTARNRSKLGAKSYHVFLYTFNATSNLTDDISGNEENEPSAVDSSSLADGPLLWSTASSLESSKSNIYTNIITQTELIEKTTFTTFVKILLKTPKMMEITTPTQITSKSSLPTSPPIGPTITTPKSISIVTILNDKENTTLAVPSDISEVIIEPNNNNISSSIRKETYENISYNITVPNNVSTSSAETIRGHSESQRNKTMKLSTKVTKSAAVTTMSTTTTSLVDLPSRKLQCSDYENRAKYFGTVGVLVLALTLMTALVACIMIKHKRMTGQWGFTAKCQTPIPMENLNDDNSCLIQELTNSP